MKHFHFRFAKTRAFGWHAFIGILTGDQFEKIAIVGIAGHGNFSAFPAGQKFGQGVHRKSAFLFPFGVTFSTLLFKHWHDLMDEIHLAK